MRMPTFWALASKPPMLSGSRLGSAVSGVGTFVWNDVTLPTLHCVPDDGSRRTTVNENVIEDGRCPCWPGDGAMSALSGKVGEVTRIAWPEGECGGASRPG